MKTTFLAVSKHSLSELVLKGLSVEIRGKEKASSTILQFACTLTGEISPLILGNGVVPRVIFSIFSKLCLDFFQFPTLSILLLKEKNLGCA